MTSLRSPAPRGTNGTNIKNATPPAAAAIRVAVAMRGSATRKNCCGKKTCRSHHAASQCHA
jgi:hypothetical protein